jgi:hypothetical protein
MMRVLSLKYAIQWIYKISLPRRIHINKVISSLLLNCCALSLYDKIFYMHLARGALSCIEF